MEASDQRVENQARRRNGPSQLPNCLICDASVAVLLDERKSVPVAQNLMYRSREAALGCPRGALRIERCMTCGFAWNSAFDPALLEYDADYENNQSLSPAFDRHLDDVAAAIAQHVGQGSAIAAVEVGCGQGYFLDRLARVFGSRLAALVGYDPAFRGESPIPPLASVEPVAFNGETCGRVGGVPDLIVTRHVIEHIADPLVFLRTLRQVSRAGTAIAVETPNLQWILDGAVAHDFYYEHCSLFDPDSLRFAMETAGFEVSSITPGLGGQYLLALGHAANDVKPAPRRTNPDNARYPERRAGYIDRWRSTFAMDRRAGEKIALWGGASKAVTLALLLDRGASDISLAIDINPARDGSFMPLSAIPVVRPEKARREQISKAYVVNPVYGPEVEQYCREQQWPLKLDVVI